MRRIAVIDPAQQQVVYKTVPDEDISRAAGIDQTSHAVVQHGSNANYGLFTSTGMQSTTPEFFALNGHLYHGPAVLYAFDQEGRTIDITRRAHPRPLWIGDALSVQSAISEGVISWPARWGPKPTAGN